MLDPVVRRFENRTYVTYEAFLKLKRAYLDLSNLINEAQKMSPKKNDLMGEDALNLLNEVIFGQKKKPKQKAKQTLFPILPPQIHKFPNQNYEIEYVTNQQIKEFHNEDFCKKFDKELYGSTCMMIEKEGQQILAIYYEDYERFARKILLGTPTYWD